MLYNLLSAIPSKITINSQKFRTNWKKLKKVDGREQSDLTLTLYTATTEGREQSNLTSILYTATTNTVPHYHRKLMEGSRAT